jgi:hypothetical protein
VTGVPGGDGDEPAALPVSPVADRAFPEPAPDEPPAEPPATPQAEPRAEPQAEPPAEPRAEPRAKPPAEPRDGLPGELAEELPRGLTVRRAVPDGEPVAEPDEPGTDDGEEPSGWDRFAPHEPPPPGVFRRGVGALGRFLAHEWTLASVVGLLLAVVMTWPTLLHPTTTIPNDVYDPLLQTWQVAWDGHALLTDPLHLWDSNTFYPSKDTLAYSDSLLGYAPFGLVGSGPVAALLRYNVLYVLAYALAFVGMYALCRQLGARRPGAAMAAAAFAYAPWRLAHGGHLNILSTGGIPLALAMLARGHGFSLRRQVREPGEPWRITGGFEPDRTRWGWALGGWAVAGWQVTLGFGLGLPFAYLLALFLVIALVAWPIVRRRRRFGGRLLLADLGGLVLFGLTCLYMGLPYLHAVQDNPNAKRSVADVALFSPPLKGFLIAPEQDRLWGSAHDSARASLSWPPEMTLLVGFVLLAFAVLGLFLSVWSVKARLLMAAGVVVSVAFAMGTQFPGGGRYTYLLLYNNLPAWDAIRTSGRLVVWTTLSLGLLAAGAVSAMAVRADDVALSRGRNPRRLGLALRLLLIIPTLLVLVEGFNATPHPTVPTEPAALHGVTGPVLILPTDQLTDQRYMYWSTDGFPKIVNGGSGFQPAEQDRIRRAAESFPDQTSVSYLRQHGIRTVVVMRDGLAGTPYENVIARSYEGLGVTVRDTGPAVIFTLR